MLHLLPLPQQPYTCNSNRAGSNIGSILSVYSCGAFRAYGTLVTNIEAQSGAEWLLQWVHSPGTKGPSSNCPLEAEQGLWGCKIHEHPSSAMQPRAAITRPKDVQAAVICSPCSSSLAVYGGLKHCSGSLTDFGSCVKRLGMAPMLCRPSQTVWKHRMKVQLSNTVVLHSMGTQWAAC